MPKKKEPVKRPDGYEETREGEDRVLTKKVGNVKIKVTLWDPEETPAPPGDSLLPT